ncbi:hypothetical protein [Pelagerythrobacter marinus]|uniref:hypothetical protein n=1 Tax=Pelagerythrobacter marinus TaxID=538382 RepID=UPI002AC994BB|nr:hypothetical protein [Pelagerythrobacter marinus]WPZ05481.1 hypothetical protein T8T98_08550 [Pelagerythrobacter marinus]
MSLQIRDAGTLRTITRLTIRQAGVNRSIRTLKVMDGGVLRTVAIFADPLAVTAPDTNGHQDSSTVITNLITATPSGGFSPYTYAWSLIANGGASPSTATAPTSAGTSFSKSGLIPGQTVTDTWRVTVTDSLGQTASHDISATFTRGTGGA